MELTHLLNGLKTSIGTYCIVCESPSPSTVCSACWSDQAEIIRPCYQCALPLQEKTETNTGLYDDLSTDYCAECLTDPPPFDRTVAIFEYRHMTALIVNQLKHHRKLKLAHYLGREISRRIREAYEEDDLPEVVQAIPMHWKHQWARGFNQADILAEALASELQLPVGFYAKKVSHMSKQHSLSRKARLKNAELSFTTLPVLEGKHIALVDDVMTTGATTAVVSQKLLEAGARRVDLWVIARTPK